MIGIILGLGSDIIDIARIDALISRFGKRFIVKIFTPAEIAAFRGGAYYAKRYAAKEAFLKALGTGFAKGIKWHDMEILNDELGKPVMNVYGNAKKIMDNLASGQAHINVSLSDTSTIAFAVVVISK